MDDMHMIDKCHMKKGASGLIVENLLGIKNNNIDDADIPEIGCEIKVLPLQKNRNGIIKPKEPTAIQLINYCEVSGEHWETAKIRRKITLTLWIAYLAKENGLSKSQEDYRIIDYYLERPSEADQAVFKQDWEFIQNYINLGKADKLSCSMGTYIEPKTKGANSDDKRDAPDGKGGLPRARRRAFYYKKNYTSTRIIPKLDFSEI